MTEGVGRLRLVVLLGSLVAALGLASPASLADLKVGVDSGVNPQATGIPPGALPRRLVLGQDILFNERITTEATGQTQVLFVDESTLSIGPNANMVIDQFVYDPNRGTGKMAASLTRGVFRFVGGKLSKQDNAVSFKTPAATIGIRGGVMLVDQAVTGALKVYFVYGKGVTVTGLNGASQTIFRPGFEVTVARPGAAPSDPAPAPPGSAVRLLAQLDGRAGANGGASTVPTEMMVAQSGVADAISSNLTASIQAARQTQPLAPQPNNVNSVVAHTQLNNQNVQVTGAFATPVNGGASVSFNQLLSNPTASATPMQTATNTISPTPSPAPIITPSPPVTPPPPIAVNPTPPVTIPTPTPTPTPTPIPVPTPTPVPTPSPVVISVAGLAKTTANPPTTAGFVLQNPPYRSPYSLGTITYPAGNVQQNGTFAATIDGQHATLSPLTPGATTAVTASLANGATATGQATMTPDGKFFYANLTSTAPASAGLRLFLFGGVPVVGSAATSTGFYAPNPNAQIYAFTVNPDGALSAPGGAPQTIPFLPSNYGGTMPNAAVSPLYLSTGANSPFGAADSAKNSFVAPKFLQASLAVNGQGANQTSALVVATGTFFTYSGTGAVVAAGPVRGTVMLNAGTPAVHIGAGLATVPDGNSNNLFGGNTLSGFVLDQNQYNFSGAYVPALASAGQFGATPANYGFNQPVTTTPLPPNVPGTRQELNETGYFGGIIAHTANPTNGSPYVLTGAVAPLQTNTDINRVAATFTGGDPFTQQQSGISSNSGMVLNFGDVAGGTDASRGTYINNNIYAATDSPITASSINGNPLPLPPNSTSAAPSPSIAMVTSGTVANNSWMPAGVTPCSCQYLQWGYWTGQVTSTATTGLGVDRIDRAYINTWIAGQPTVNLPTTGFGTYQGAAVGSVFNGGPNLGPNGATYLAAGGFNQTYNFSARTGTVNITQFDGANYTSTVRGGGGGYAGALGGSGTFGNRAGALSGSFYGPGVAETGGSFNLQAVSGPKYLASGIFAGKQIP